MSQNRDSIKEAMKIYSELKKSNFTDVEISKIAHIIQACAIDDSHWP